MHRALSNLQLQPLFSEAYALLVGIEWPVDAVGNIRCAESYG